MTQWGLDSLFNPSKRHMDEEKRRLQATREEVGDNSGGERIDLVSGKVVIRRKPKDETTDVTETTEASAGSDDTDTGSAATGSADTDGSDVAPAEDDVVK